MWDGDKYDYLMGRWSRLIAPQLVRFADIQDGEHVLDVGSGTGSLTQAVLDVGPTVRVNGVDGSAEFVEIARKTVNNERAAFKRGDAQSLPYPNRAFDKCVSLLVLNFVPDPKQSVNEMKRVTKVGGTIAAAVWDYGDGMEMLRCFWNEATKVDPSAEAKHERDMPLCRKGELGDLCLNCGLMNVEETALEIRLGFKSFDDYWAPFLTGIGPSGAYVTSLDASIQAQLKERLREQLVEGDNERAFALNAKAWAVRGEVGT